MKRILFTTPFEPFMTMDGASVNDIHGSRLTHGQGIFTQSSYYPHLPLYLLAMNVQAPATLLENPSREEFVREVRAEYDFVCISFTPIFLDKVLQMCQLVRKESPRSRIILGGYGVICLRDEFELGRQVRALADEVCHEEGVAFLQRILGEEERRPLVQDFPLNRTYLLGQEISRIHSIVSALGCKGGCEYCATSAFYKKEKVYLLTPQELWNQMQSNLRRNLTNLSWVYDEDFFNPPEYARAFLQIARAAPDLDRSRLNWGTFGSIKALSEFHVDELLEMGINHLWVGIESKFSELEKRQGKSVSEVFSTLRQSGIMTVGSFIVGLDCQDPQNIDEDIGFLVAQEPTVAQVTGMMPCPGTELWQKLFEDDRLRLEGLSWDDYHMYTTIFQPKNFRPDEIMTYSRLAYRRLYEELGPSALRALDVHLNGLSYCRRHPNPIIRARSPYYAGVCRQIYPLLPAIRNLAPTPTVARRAARLRLRVEQEVGPPRLADRCLGIAATCSLEFFQATGLTPPARPWTTSRRATFRQ